MDALDRILPLAALLWPVRDCDVSISRDPATGDAAFRRLAALALRGAAAAMRRTGASR